MGSAIQANDIVFTSPNLPVIALPYEGITDGLLAAYQLRSKASLALVPVAGSVVAPATEIGAPTWQPNAMLGDGANGIDSGIPLGTTYTLYSVFRRPSGTNIAFGAGATYAAAGLRVAATTAGWRAQMNMQTSAGASTSGNYIGETFFADLDAITKDVTRYEFVAFSVDPAANLLRFHLPRVGLHKSLALPTDGRVQPAAETAATVTYAAEKVGNYSGEVCQVAAGGHFNRQLSQTEVIQQYSALQAYCARVGIEL